MDDATYAEDYDGSLWQEEYPQKHLADAILKWCSPVCLFVGIIGNIISAFVLLRMSKLVLSTCAYLAVAAVTDSLTLAQRASNDWLSHLMSYNIRKEAMLFSNAACKLYPFTEGLTLHISLWLVVAMATESALVSLRPERLSRVCTMERTRAVILLLTVLLICINAHSFWTYALVKEADGTGKEVTRCTNARQGHHNSEEFRKVVWPVLEIVVAHLFPFFAIFSCAVILVTRRLKGIGHSSWVAAWNAYCLDASAAAQLQLSFMFICLSHLLFGLPRFALDIFEFLIDPLTLGLVDFSLELEAQMEVARACVQVALYLFLSSKFFLYVSSSSRFRVEVAALFRWCCCCCCPSNRANNSGGVGNGGRSTKRKTRNRMQSGAGPSHPQAPLLCPQQQQQQRCHDNYVDEQRLRPSLPDYFTVVHPLENSSNTPEPPQPLVFSSTAV